MRTDEAKPNVVYKAVSNIYGTYIFKRDENNKTFYLHNDGSWQTTCIKVDTTGWHKNSQELTEALAKINLLPGDVELLDNDWINYLEVTTKIYMLHRTVNCKSDSGYFMTFYSREDAEAAYERSVNELASDGDYLYKEVFLFEKLKHHAL